MSMGSEGTVTRQEAAEILEVSASMVSHLTREGILRPKMVDGQSYGGRVYYDAEEVSALKEARERKQTLPAVADTAAQAWAAARIAQRRIEVLEKLLGLKVPSLPDDAESIQALHLQAEDDIKRVINGADRVNFWADKFFAICESYLHRVSDVMGTDEPWKVYLELSTRLKSLQDLDSSESDPFEQMAYKRLHTSVERLRRSIFIYCLQRWGKQKAFSFFPSEFYGPHHDVMMHATEEW